MENNYLTLARRAREEGDTEDAKKYYDLLRTEDPENVEARFFFPYYRLWDGTKGEAFNKFVSFSKVMPSMVKNVAASSESEEAKVKLLLDIYNCIKDITYSMGKIQQDLMQNAPDRNYYNNQRNKCYKIGIEMLYSFGDDIEKIYSTKKELMDAAIEAWKKGASYQQQFPYCGVDKTLAEKYANKIQKYDPSYTLPKKAGCISIG